MGVLAFGCSGGGEDGADGPPSGQPDARPAGQPDAPPGGPQIARYVLTNVNVPSAATGTTIVNGINDHGLMVGQYHDAGGKTHGFLDDSGTFTTIDYPGSAGTIANGINDDGTIAGTYTEANGSTHGFVDDGGTFTALDYPGAKPGTTLGQGINDAGDVVGQYQDNGNKLHGFLHAGGSYTSFDYPGVRVTYGFGVNDSGAIAGYYEDDDGTFHGFLDSGGTFTDITYLNARTLATGISNAGVVVAFVGIQSFIYDNGQFALVTPTVAVNSITVFGINESRQIVGFYSTLAGVSGFVATPVTSSAGE